MDSSVESFTSGTGAWNHEEEAGTDGSDSKLPPDVRIARQHLELLLHINVKNLHQRSEALQRLVDEVQSLATSTSREDKSRFLRRYRSVQRLSVLCPYPEVRELLSDLVRELLEKGLPCGEEGRGQKLAWLHGEADKGAAGGS